MQRAPWRFSSMSSRGGCDERCSGLRVLFKELHDHRQRVLSECVIAGVNVSNNRRAAFRRIDRAELVILFALLLAAVELLEPLDRRLLPLELYERVHLARDVQHGLRL